MAEGGLRRDSKCKKDSVCPDWFEDEGGNVMEKADILMQVREALR